MAVDEGSRTLLREIATKEAKGLLSAAQASALRAEVLEEVKPTFRAAPKAALPVSNILPVNKVYTAPAKPLSVEPAKVPVREVAKSILVFDPKTGESYRQFLSLAEIQAAEAKIKADEDAKIKRETAKVLAESAKPAPKGGGSSKGGSSVPNTLPLPAQAKKPWREGIFGAGVKLAETEIREQGLKLTRILGEGTSQDWDSRDWENREKSGEGFVATAIFADVRMGIGGKTREGIKVFFRTELEAIRFLSESSEIAYLANGDGSVMLSRDQALATLPAPSADPVVPSRKSGAVCALRGTAKNAMPGEADQNRHFVTKIVRGMVAAHNRAAK